MNEYKRKPIPDKNKLIEKHSAFNNFLRTPCISAWNNPTRNTKNWTILSTAQFRKSIFKL